jgi:hypothetical protein
MNPSFVRWVLVPAVVCAAAGAPCLAAREQAPAESPVELTLPGGKVSGTLLVPPGAGKVPVVLIIAGSGPTDRNGNSQMLGGRNDSLKMIADALAAEGIASLRYDKRGIGASVVTGLREIDMRFEVGVEDAVAWVGLLRKDARFSTVTVVGHSEGSLIGMLAVRQAKADAFVSIAGVAQGAAGILRDQLRPQIGSIPALWEGSDAVLSSLEAGKTVDPLPAAIAAVPGLASLFRPSVQPYVISWLKYVPTAEIAKLTVPVLILQGTTDIQVTVAEAKALAAAKPDAQLKIIDGMNHVLKAVPSDMTQQVASYSDPALPIVADVPKAIAALVKGVRQP